MEDAHKLWLSLGALLVLSFGVLLILGGEIYRQAPPIPERVVSEDGTVLYTGDDVVAGRRVWQSMDGMQLGSIWGHGSYVAPDWSADWLHREATGLLELWATREQGKSFDALTAEQR